MYTFIKNASRRALVKIAVVLLPIPAVVSTLCSAGESLSLAAPDEAVVRWTSGPARASLGSLVEIKIPAGYRFTDVAGAKDLLHQMKNPVPNGLVGILAPESGQWWAVLTYKDIGYVKDAGKSPIDATAILKSITDRAQRQNEDRAVHGLAPITSVNWKLPPAFDATAHTVEWAVQAQTQGAQVINHTMRLLGRQGVLDATVVEPYHNGADLTPLKSLMENISFKPGQRYTDYQKGDTVADIGLAGLITGDEDSVAAQKDTAAAAAKGAGGWSWYGYVGIGVLAGGGALLLRGAFRRRHHKKYDASVSALTNGIGKENEIGGIKTFAQTHAALALSAPAASDNGHQPVDAKPAQVKPVAKPEEIKTEAVAGSGSHHHRGERRRKVFDYHLFYTDTVLKLSSGSYVGAPNGAGKTNGRLNGSLDRTAAKKPAQGNLEQSIVQAHLDLIANQKDLIEEQKRLMIQQAKLIEEKSKLIAEKSQLLDRQTDLFERDIL